MVLVVVMSMIEIMIMILVMIIRFITRVASFLFYLRPWPNDQTFVVKHLKFAVQAEWSSFCDVAKHCSPKFFACFWQLFKNIAQ